MDVSIKNCAKSYNFTCYWRIENFSLNSDNNFSILSPSFEIRTLKSKWYLEITKEGNYLGVFLFKAAGPKFCLTKLCISLLTSTDWVPVTENPNYRYRDNFCGYGVFKVVTLEKLNKEPWTHLPNGSLTISFSVKNNSETEYSQCLLISRMVNENELLHRPVESFSDLKPDDLLFYPRTYTFHSGETLPAVNQKATEVKSQHTQTEDSDQLFNFFKEQEFSFVTLKTPNKEFVVHKAVLCANSPIFNAMLENQMKENDYDSIDIDDIDSQTMTSFIKFLHFQSLDDLNWDSAVTLYYAAEKYQIDSLRKECVVYLERELSVENVCDAFLLADLHRDEDLMRSAQEYFSRNVKSVFTSTQWKEFLCHTELVAEILHKLGEMM